MKTILRISALLFLGALTATGLRAAFESARFDPDNALPRYPDSLLMEGITRGNVIIALSISAEGKVSDSLVLGYTQAVLATRCQEALKEWRFTPARLDGDPVATQITLTFNITVEGVVVSGNIVNHFLFDHFDRMGDGHFAYRLRAASELDRLPARVNTVATKYALEAEKQGVRGKVRVHFYIDEQGAVRLPAVDSAAESYLSEKAVTAIREWRFEPPTHLGQPVVVAANQEFDFSSAK